MIQHHVNYVMAEDEMYTIACSDDVCHVKRSLLRHYHILDELVVSPDELISVPRARASVMKKALSIWSRVEEDELAEVLDVLIYLEVDGETLREWIKRLPRNYVKLLPHNITRYLWEAGWRYKECSGVVPQWLDFKLEDAAAALALTTGTTAKDYRLYLGHVIFIVGERQCYDEEHEAMVKMARDDGILPPTLMTCDLNDTPVDKLYDMYQEHLTSNVLPVPHVVLERLLEVRRLLLASPKGLPPTPSFHTVTSGLIRAELHKNSDFKLVCRDGELILALDDAKQYAVLRQRINVGKFAAKYTVSISDASCLRLPASLPDPEFFASYMAVLRCMQPTWRVMKQWIRLLPRKYAQLLPHSLLVWLWKFRSSVNTPPEGSVPIEIAKLGASLALSMRQSAIYVIYLQHLLDKYNEVARVLVDADSHERRDVRDALATLLEVDSVYGVLPHTVLTCEELTPEAFTTMLRELGDLAEYPEHVRGAVAAAYVSSVKDVDKCTIS